MGNRQIVNPLVCGTPSMAVVLTASPHRRDSILIKVKKSSSNNAQFIIQDEKWKMKNEKFKLPSSPESNDYFSLFHFSLFTLRSALATLRLRRTFNSQLSTFNSHLSTLNFQLSTFSSQLSAFHSSQTHRHHRMTVISIIFAIGIMQISVIRCHLSLTTHFHKSISINHLCNWRHSDTSVEKNFFIFAFILHFSL